MSLSALLNPGESGSFGSGLSGCSARMKEQGYEQKRYACKPLPMRHRHGLHHPILLHRGIRNGGENMYPYSVESNANVLHIKAHIQRGASSQEQVSAEVWGGMKR